MTTNIINPTTGQLGYQIPGASLPTGYVSQPVNPTIDSGSLGKTNGFIIPPTQPQTNPATPIIASAQSQVDAAQKQAEATVAKENAPVDAIQTQKQGFLDKIQGLVGQISGAQTAGANRPEVDQANTDLANINKQIADVTIQQRADSDSIKARGDISSQAQQGLQFNSDSKYGRSLADLAIRQSAASNNVLALTKAADDKLKLTLAPLETELDNYKNTVLPNLDKFTQVDQDKIKQIIDEKERIIKQQTDNANIGNTALKTAIENGVKVPDAVVQKVLANPSQAYSILASAGISLQDPQEKAYKQAQINSLNAAAAAKTASGASGGGVSDALTNAINNGTIDPNKINSRTLSIYNAIAQAGVDAVGSHAGAAGETKAITDLSTYKSTAVRTLGVLESNLPLVEDLADKVNTIGIPLLDAYASGKKAILTNDPNVIKYVNSLKTLRAEYAQMLAKGNATTESDKAEAAQAIPAGLSSAGYAALGQQLKLEATNILSASDAAIQSAKSKSASNTGGTNLNSQFDALFNKYNGQ